MKNTVKVFAAFVGAPLVVLGVSAPTAWAAPGGGCSGPCTVGGTGNGGVNSDGKATGVHLVGPNGGSNSGHVVAGTGFIAGHLDLKGTGGPGTFSGNFAKGTGRCTGTLSGFC
jgi:hypothetical protein